MRAISYLTLTLFVALPAFADEADNHYKRALDLKKENKLDQATDELLQAIKLRPSYGAAEFTLGNVYNRRGQFEKAVEHFEKAAKILGGNGDVLANLGVVYHKLNRDEEAVKTLEKACELSPSNALAQSSL